MSRRLISLFLICMLLISVPSVCYATNTEETDDIAQSIDDITDAAGGLYRAITNNTKIGAKIGAAAKKTLNYAKLYGLIVAAMIGVIIAFSFKAAADAKIDKAVDGIVALRKLLVPIFLVSLLIGLLSLLIDSVT